MLDAVVIGTGFGGAVASCRLAQAGLSVTVLERGKRYPKGGFPRDFANIGAGWLWADGRGLYDVRPINEMTVVQAAGYGGGSLVYANVHLRPTPDVFAAGWPAGYGRPMLDPYYDLVAYMLDIKPITASPRGLPPKTKQLAAAAAALGRSEQFCYPNLAVNFAPAGVVADNKHGVPQEGCSHCGECDIGCNVHAKNTLDLNYLALAERAGAVMRTECEASTIEPLGPGAGYRVTFADHTRGGATETIEARTLFVCAGAVGSTELLLRCRDEHRSLPLLSAQLGARYSGNGDLLAFTFGTAAEFRPSDGPTITAGIVVQGNDGNRDGDGDGAGRGEAPGTGSWFIFEDGGCPKEVAALLQMLTPGENFLGRAAALLRGEVGDWLRRAARERERVPSPSDGAAALRTGVFLAMGRDRANGRIKLDPLGKLCVLWDVPSNLPLYDAEEQIAADVSTAMGGKVAFSPTWEQARTPVSVHNLGGCVMADSPVAGVVDGDGVVFGYPGLHVLDGAALPEATGVNPSHTIAAVAERNVEGAIRRLTGQAAWQAPERARAQPIIDPVSLVKIPPGGTAPPRTPTIGLSFSEKLTGYHLPGTAPPPTASAGVNAAAADVFAAAEEAGRKLGMHLGADITISTAHLDRFLDEPAHAALLTGTVHADGITGPGGAPIRAGVFNLYPDDPAGGPPRLRYAMPFIGADGRAYVLDGTANVAGAHGQFDPSATRTVYATVRQGLGGEGPVMSAGIVRLGFLAMIDEMKSLRLTGTAGLVARKDALLRFFRAFVGPVAETLLKEVIP